LNFGYLSAGHYICVRIRAYYSKPAGVRKKDVWETLVHIVPTINITKIFGTMTRFLTYAAVPHT